MLYIVKSSQIVNGVFPHSVFYLRVRLFNLANNKVQRKIKKSLLHAYFNKPFYNSRCFNRLPEQWTLDSIYIIPRKQTHKQTHAHI